MSSSMSSIRKRRRRVSLHSNVDRANNMNGFNDRHENGRWIAKYEDLLNRNEVHRSLSSASVILDARCDAFPVFECFATEISSLDARKKLYDDLRIGDELCFRIKRVELAGVYAEPICTLHSFRRNLKWIDDFQVLLQRNLLNGQDYRPNDLIKVVVVGIEDETKLPIFSIDVEAGLLTGADLPAYFRNGEKMGNKSFDEYLRNYLPANNPNLATLFGIETKSTVSFLHELRDSNFTSKHRAPYIRQKQDEYLSMSLAKRGVEKIREGDNSVAVQHFNRALTIYDKNIEALVGRGAAYANMGQYALAETDLDAALAIDEKHANAQKYMIETLLQEAKKLEKNGKKDEAKLKYVKILSISSDVRAVDRLRNLEKSPSEEEVEYKKNEKTRGHEKERTEDEESIRVKRRRDAQKDVSSLLCRVLALIGHDMMIKEELDLGRCLCIHSQLQAVDIILQSLLYQRGVVPTVVSQLLSSVSSQNEVKFVETYTEIRLALKNLFRSANRRALKEVVIIIGSSCATPQEIYRIPIRVCDSYDSDISHCGENCGELSSKEQRQLSSSLVLSPNLYSLRNITRNTRVYVLVCGIDDLKFPEALVENDASFELPEEEILARRNINSVRFILKHPCVETIITVCNPGTTWFRLSPFIKAFF
ncbi:unnamed protein product [Thelazia callipaeda]|uniref:TPR_REGION domain-containing protein n=1 Tax=Thelazia callipaeda TaxID=103827 RepID=A0A0N5D3Q2_THECL|nr:unnamed protein product [Thelazia callipaeda]